MTAASPTARATRQPGGRLASAHRSPIVQLLRHQRDRRSLFMKILIIAVVVVVVLLVLGLALAVRIVKQYQKGVLFRLGRRWALGSRACG
jgi:hypothetical protein